MSVQIVLSRVSSNGDLRFAPDTAAPAAAVQSAGAAAMGPGPRSFVASLERLLGDARFLNALGNQSFPAPTSDVFKSAVPGDSVDVPTEEPFVREPPADKDFTPQSEKKPTPQSARSVGAMLSLSRCSIHGL